MENTLPIGHIAARPDWQFTRIRVGGEGFLLADGPDMPRKFTPTDFNFLEQTLRLDTTKYQLILTDKGEIYILEPNPKGHKTRKMRAATMRTVGGVRGYVQAIFNINPQNLGHTRGIRGLTE